MLAVAVETGLSPAQVSLAWLLGREPTAAAPHVPIIGPRTVDHLDAYLQALDAELTAEQVKADMLPTISAAWRVWRGPAQFACCD